MTGSRYVVGIDLGTTNCAVAYVDTATEGEPAIETLRLPQVVAPGEVEALPTLPSFLLLPGPHDVQAGAMALPWADDPGYAVGAFARDRGAELPHRLVASAKSWLCNTEVDLTEPILPWRSKATADDDGGEPAERLSPIDAAARYLAHIRAAWDAAHPDAPLAEQDLLLTVPASFDAVAADLTALAAKHAGLPSVTLLEEPQAAFYCWLSGGDDWRDQLGPGDVVLVCDVGGGTTDFSLIEVIDDEGSLALERIAVGDHILLGGDNMDLALAYTLAARLEQGGKKLSAKQRAALTHACRRAKEQLLGDDPPDKVPISVLGGGSKLIGGTLRTELTRADLEQIVVAGFLPEVDADAVPTERKRMGLGELGLPYAADAAITRHLARFLARRDRKPTAILFNGGVMTSPTLRERVARIVGGWCGGGDALTALSGTDLDLAVAHGAAYYGLVRRGKGVRIRGGTARAYYIGIETAMPAIPGFEPPVNALCVVPFGLDEGDSVDLPAEELGLVVGEPADFRFFAASNRADDRPGDVVEADGEQVVELAPIHTRLDPGEGHEVGERVPVTLSANVTETGNLELWCVARDGSGRWKLSYSVRDD